MKKFLIIVLIFALHLSLNIQYVFAKENVQQNFEKMVLKGDFQKAGEYLNLGAEINSSKKCLLCYSIIDGRNDVFDFLIENGANPNGTTRLWTPLYFAIHNNNNYAIDKLLKYGANPNKEAAVPLLYHSVVKRNTSAVEKLLNAGADPKQTFMKINAAELAFSKNNKDIIDTFIKFQEKDFKIPPTDINKSIDLLNTIENGKPFYEIIRGKNKLNKPVNIRYINLSTFGDYNPDIYFAIAYLKNKELTIFIDNKYRNEPPEVIALIAAGNSVHIDKKNSQTEYLYRIGAQALMYEEFLIKNPKLKDNKDSYPIQKDFNPILALLQIADYDMNIYWHLVQKGMFGKNIKETSPGFKNTDLNSYFESKE